MIPPLCDEIDSMEKHEGCMAGKKASCNLINPRLSFIDGKTLKIMKEKHQRGSETNTAAGDFPLLF